MTDEGMGDVVFKDYDERDDGKLVYSIVENGKTPFRLTEKGEMSFAQGDPATLGLRIDYEAASFITISVMGTDTGDPQDDPVVGLTVVGPYNIYVCNRNDPPVLFPTTVSVKENSPKGYFVGTPLPYLEQDVGQELTFTIEGGNIPQDMAQKIKPIFGRDGAGMKDRGAWWDVTEFVVLGPFVQPKTTGCGIKASNIAGLENVVGDTWFPEGGRSWFEQQEECTQAMVDASQCDTLSVNPEPSTATKELKWTTWKTGSAGKINFQRAASPTMGGNMDAATAYAAVYLYADADKNEVKMGVGSDDGIMTWVNGEEIAELSPYRVCRDGVTRAANTAPVDLVKGENIVLMKVTDRDGGWGAMLSLADVEGVFASNVRLNATEIAQIEGRFHSEAVFAFSPAQVGQLVVNQPEHVDYEYQKSYTLTVRATDNGLGALSDTARVNIQIDDVNEAPELTGVLAIHVDENNCGKGNPWDGTCTGATSIGNVGSFDLEDDTKASLNTQFKISSSSLFQISQQGNIQLQPGKVLDYEDESEHTFIVMVQDSGGLLVSSPYTVKVRNTNDPLLLQANQHRVVDENTPTGGKIGAPLVAKDSDLPPLCVFPFTYKSTTYSSCSDMGANGEPQAFLWCAHDTVYKSGNEGPSGTWSKCPEPQMFQFRIKAQDKAGLFVVGRETGQLAVGEFGKLDFETKRAYTITVEAVDCGGLAGDCDLAFSGNNRISTQQVSIAVRDINEAPALSDARISVLENAGAYEPIGQPVVGTDPDVFVEQKLRYTIESGNDDMLFEIEGCSGQVSLSKRGEVIDFEARRRYKLGIQVEDRNGLSDTATAIIEVLDVNEPPLFDRQAFDVDENSAVGTLVGELAPAFDPDYPMDSTVSTADTDCVEWSSVGAVSATATFDFALDTGTKKSCRATSDVDSAHSWCYVKQGADAFAKEMCSHQDVKYALTAGNADGRFAIDADSGAITLARATLNYERAIQHVVRVSACDWMGVDGAAVQHSAFHWSNRIGKSYDHGSGLCTQAWVVIKVNDVNDQPQIMGRSLVARSVQENAETGFVLDGPAFMARDEDADKMYWSVKAGDGYDRFNINAKGEIYVDLRNGATLDFEQRTGYVVEFVGRDREVATNEFVKMHSGKVTINLRDVNEAPVLEDQSGTISEDAAPGTQVGPTAGGADSGCLFEVKDQDAAQTYEWTLSGGNTNTAFVVSPVANSAGTKAQVSVGLTQLSQLKYMDFESSNRNTYALQVKVRDMATQSQEGVSALVASATCTVTVVDANEAPTFPTDADYTRTVPEDANGGENNKVYGGKGVLANDQDSGDEAELTYAIDIANSGPFASFFAIDSKTAILTVKHPGSNTAEPFDYEDLTQRADGYKVVVTATDPAGASASVTVRVDVTDINEAPVLGHQWRGVPETALQGASVGSVIAAHDQDLDGNQRLTYTLDMNQTHGEERGFGDEVNGTWLFGMTNFGQIYVNRGPSEGYVNLNLDAAQPWYRNLTVCVTDSGFPSPNEQSSQTTCSTVSIEVLEANEPPYLPKGRITTIPENLAPGSVVGEPLTVGRQCNASVDYNDRRGCGAFDPDEDDVLYYSIIGGDDMNLFQIGRETGVLQVRAGAVVDYEKRTQFDIKIQVEDWCPDNRCKAQRYKGNLTISTTYTVQVTDVNEAPTLVGSACEIEERAPTDTPCEHSALNPKVSTLVTDQDANDDSHTFSFRVGSGDFAQETADGTFKMDEKTGVIYSTGKVLDYETKPLYRLVVVAFDKGGLASNEVKVDVVLTNVNDPPKLDDRYVRRLPENSFKGYRVGAPLPGSDQDANDRVLYSLTGDNCWASDVTGAKGGSSAYRPPFSAGRVESAGQKKQVSFEVKAPNGATISIRSDRDDDRSSYQIALGEAGNTVSMIKRCDTNGVCKDCGWDSIFPRPPVLEELNYTMRTVQAYETARAGTSASGTVKRHKTLTLGDFGLKDANGKANCDDDTTDLTCEGSSWAGSSQAGSVITLNVPDSNDGKASNGGKDYDFTITKIQVKKSAAATRAYAYDLPLAGDAGRTQEPMMLLVDLADPAVVASGKLSNLATAQCAAISSEDACSAPCSWDTASSTCGSELSQLEIRGGTQIRRVGGTNTLYSSKSSAGRGLPLYRATWGRGPTHYYRSNHGTTTSKFLEVYAENDWIVEDGYDHWSCSDRKDAATCNPDGDTMCSWSGGKCKRKDVYSGPGSWSVACDNNSPGGSRSPIKLVKAGHKSKAKHYYLGKYVGMASLDACSDACRMEDGCRYFSFRASDGSCYSVQTTNPSASGYTADATLSLFEMNTGYDLDSSFSTCSIRQRSNIHSSGYYNPIPPRLLYNWRQMAQLGSAVVFNNPEALKWTDYAFKLKIKSGDNDWIGVQFRRTDNKNYYTYEMGVEISARRLKKTVNGVTTILKELVPSGCPASTKTCANKKPRHCTDILELNKEATSGVYTINPDNGKEDFKVYCDMDTEPTGPGGPWDGKSNPWTVIMRRNKNSKTSFYRTWYDYEEGFPAQQHTQRIVQNSWTYSTNSNQGGVGGHISGSGQRRFPGGNQGLSEAVAFARSKGHRPGHELHYIRNLNGWLYMYGAGSLGGRRVLNEETGEEEEHPDDAKATKAMEANGRQLSGRKGRNLCRPWRPPRYGIKTWRFWPVSDASARDAVDSGTFSTNGTPNNANSKHGFWLGLSRIRRFYNGNGWMQLRVDLQEGGSHGSAQYNYFAVGSRGDRFRLYVYHYHTPAGANYIGNGLGYHHHRRFTSRDVDNDSWGGNCASRFLGGWWYGRCHVSNLLGVNERHDYARGKSWRHWRSYYVSIDRVQMAVRPRPGFRPITACSPSTCHRQDHARSYHRNHWYDLEVKAVRDRLQVLIGGSSVFDVKDASLTKGTVALWNAANHYSEFKEIQIDSLSPDEGVGGPTIDIDAKTGRVNRRALISTGHGDAATDDSAPPSSFTFTTWIYKNTDQGASTNTPNHNQAIVGNLLRIQSASGDLYMKPPGVAIDKTFGWNLVAQEAESSQQALAMLGYKFGKTTDASFNLGPQQSYANGDYQEVAITWCCPKGSTSCSSNNDNRCLDEETGLAGPGSTRNFVRFSVSDEIFVDKRDEKHSDF